MKFSAVKEILGLKKDSALDLLKSMGVSGDGRGQRLDYPEYQVFSMFVYLKYKTQLGSLYRENRRFFHIAVQFLYITTLRAGDEELPQMMAFYVDTEVGLYQFVNGILVQKIVQNREFVEIMKPEQRYTMDEILAGHESLILFNTETLIEEFYSKMEQVLD